MKTLQFLVGIGIFFFSLTQTNAQVGIGTMTPDTNAMLDISSDSKGILIPRVDYTKLPNGSSCRGLLAYVVENGPEGNDAFYYFTGITWKRASMTDSTAWETIYGKPSTLSGFGISDAVSTTGFSATENDYVGTNNNMPLKIKANNQEALRVETSGNVSIGTMNGSARLTVNAPAGQDPLKLENLRNQTTGQNSYLVIDSAGNVKKGSPVTDNILSFNISVNVPEINNNSSYLTTVAVPGAQTGAAVMVGHEIDPSAYGGTVLIQGWVQSPGYVSIRWSNVSNTKADLPLTVYHLKLFQ